MTIKVTKIRHLECGKYVNMFDFNDLFWCSGCGKMGWWNSIEIEGPLEKETSMKECDVCSSKMVEYADNMYGCTNRDCLRVIFDPIRDKKESYGHPRFHEILDELARLHSDKNHDYAMGGDPLGNFKRRAAIYAMYPGLDLSDPAVVALVDSLKQLDAVLWLCSNKHEAKVEGKAGRLRDIAVYAVIAMILEEEK